jgi:dimethylaniline monooxygenase (N-oxide forming) / hypotaurine monooxygenase
METVDLDVAIIGGGWSGILACKSVKENGLSVLAFEATDDVGGVFKLREETTDVGGVIQSTHLTSSKTITEMSDFPMPHDYPQFPSHHEVLEYLKSYIDRFNIKKNILLNTRITSVRKENGLWVLIDGNKKVYRSQNLIVTSGVHQFPNRDILKEDERFAGANVKMIHSCEYKKIEDEHRDKNILVYGGGETASDIIFELGMVAKKIFWSIPNGQWFVNRYHRKATNSDNPIVLDTFSSKLRFLFDPSSNPVCGQFIVEKQAGKCGHGIKEWVSPAPYWGQFFNKSAHIFHYFPLGTLKPKERVVYVKDGQATFKDGSSEKIDLILFCTGFKTKFPFLEEQRILPINERYKFIFDNDDPTLAFIGFARPVVGSIPGIAEVQSIYVSKVFSKQIQLPRKDMRDKSIIRDKSVQKKKYAKTSGRITGLVDFFDYTAQIAKCANIYPNYYKLFMESPRKWLKAITAPYNNCQYLLNEKEHHDQIFITFNRHVHPELTTMNHIKFLFINLLPSLYLMGEKSRKPLLFTGLVFLWVILSPVILYRFLAHILKSKTD